MKINLTIDRFEGDQAVLVDSSDHTIIWPRTKLPEEFKEGQILVFDISSDGAETKSQEAAKDILNEILDIKE